jgi:hypothetical protein
MAEAQLKFKITLQSLKRLDSYVPTEGSENYVHASFEVESDGNIDDPALVVYARYDNEIYTVPKNTETGFYDIPVQANMYPGFYISCRVFNEDGVSRYTEEVFVQVAGNGNILKRYIKSSNEYSLELFSTFYGLITKNSSDIKELTDKLDVVILALKELGVNSKSAYSSLTDKLNALDKQEEDTSSDSESSESVDTSTEDNLVSGDGFFVG